ncbi:hypothetical protein D9756_002830 [Leucocoprinus leucothites]|uniref:GATA-type domain-containing protein n=1 Tax=Leucocoprinus leucothites TaxID=201217 RepID=A0A8H5GBT7_9AGAR|nr:hypothetical protein D9756_002830 [Leucoagaricus leucothites]
MATLGWQADSSSRDTKEDAIDPALRDSDKQTDMSVNVRMHSRYDHPQQTNQQQRLPSPPPITTLHPSHSHSHSPAPSDDRSSIGTPPVRRSPHLYPPPYQHIQHPAYMPYPTPHFDHHQRYDHGPGGHQDPNHPPPHPHPYAHPGHPGHPPQFSIPTMHPPPPPHRGDPYHPYPVPGSQPVSIVHTDDAATKLSDRVRRRCFNCCTTDTSTWRRSNLSPGKVLCNKCGLFERTHSRPRPEQFPHKRGPLAASTLRGRTPPSNQLPPISPPTGGPGGPPPGNSYYAPPPLSDPRRDGPPPPSQYPPPPPPATSANATNGSSGGNGQSLPGLQSWHSAGTTSSSGPADNGPAPAANGDAGNAAGTGSPHMPPPPSRKNTAGESSQPHSQSQSRQASPSPNLRAATLSGDSNARSEGAPQGPGGSGDGA